MLYSKGGSTQLCSSESITQGLLDTAAVLAILITRVAREVHLQACEQLAAARTGIRVPKAWGQIYRCLDASAVLKRLSCALSGKSTRCMFASCSDV